MWQDGSGSIDFEEFLNMMTAKMSDKDTREDINKVFNLFDDDQTGHITLRNLKRVAKELGETMSGEGKRIACCCTKINVSIARAECCSVASTTLTI